MTTPYCEALFSYGTLQYPKVQFSTFGRYLSGTPDVLQGYALSTTTITDPDVIATSGESVHKLLIATGNAHDEVSGTVFYLSREELAQADRYEVDCYQRVRVQLKSGASAWAYVSVNEIR